MRTAEDFNYVARAGKAGRFGILKSVPIITSARRLEKDGIVIIILRTVAHTILRILVGDERADVFGYDFDHSKKGKRKFTKAMVEEAKLLGDKLINSKVCMYIKKHAKTFK